MNKRIGLVKDIAYGMIGGLIGTLALEQVGNFLYKVESEEKRRRKRALEKKIQPRLWRVLSRRMSLAERFG